MTTPTKLLAGCLVTTLAAGCIPTLHPFYTDETLIDCSGLIGRWQSDDGKQSWNFSRISDRQCQLVYTDNLQHRGTFDVHLTRLGDQLFMDLAPRPPFDPEVASFYKHHWVKSHTFYKVEITSESLSLAFLDPDWMKSYLRDNPEELALEQYGNSSVLVTANTEQLRNFVQTHMQATDVFAEPVTLNRVGRR